MSRESATALFDRLTGDTSFRDQLLAAASNEQRRRLVVEAGYDVDPSDLPMLRELAGLGELSDEELEQVAGGGLGTIAGISAGAFGGLGIGVGAAVIAAIP